MADSIDQRSQKDQFRASDINILLLGETGVGKSTFINAFVNYLEFSKFKWAKRSKLRCIIPSKFIITDKMFTQKTVQIGKDENENDNVGESCTQNVRSYVFQFGKEARLRLIDTPGIGDTRGIIQDNKNLENILLYISRLPHLHAICFLLKPNHARITVPFEYCIKQLLTKLEKNASQNVVFIFTNSRSTFYRPGDTKPALEKILNETKHASPSVEIPFNKNNVFCLDNEAFRFMLALEHNIEFTESERDSFVSSWNQSVRESWRMISYIIGDHNNGGIKPHEVEATTSVNRVRRLITLLSQILTDLTRKAEEKTTILDRVVKKVDSLNTSRDELKEKLYISVKNVRQLRLSSPEIVCTNTTCCVQYVVSGNNKQHYKRRCYSCNANNIPQNIIGTIELLKCDVFKNSKACSTCSCDFSSHMCIMYATQEHDDKIKDTGVETEITRIEQERMGYMDQNISLISELKEYKKERETILQNVKKFSQFLKSNAIMPYNNAYKRYLEYLIETEDSYGFDANNNLITLYKDMLQQCDQEEKIMNVLCENSNLNKLYCISSEEIKQCVNNLFSLKYSGSAIKTLYSNEIKLEEIKSDEKSEQFLAFSRPLKIRTKLEEMQLKSEYLQKLIGDMLDKYQELEMYFEQSQPRTVEITKEKLEYVKDGEQLQRENELKKKYFFEIFGDLTQKFPEIQDFLEQDKEAISNIKDKLEYVEKF